MDTRVLICLFVAMCACRATYAHVGSLCRPNERLLMCGCPKTCKDPAPDCAGVCQPGCYCEEGDYRNDVGNCVKLSECPPIMSAYLQDTTEPRANNGDCPPYEEYRFCEPCPKSCDNPNPVCPAQCSRGCFCVEGLLRNNKGQCVKPNECKNSSMLSPMLYQMTCSPHQVYKQCETCERTCSNPKPRCPTPCKTGCFCEEDYVMAPDGKCMKLEQCPKAEISIGHPETPTIEDCAPNEEYFFCGWCEPSCSEPNPFCPNKMCITGCLCRPPLLRHHSGQCVEQKDCIPHINKQRMRLVTPRTDNQHHARTGKCQDPNEEYVCRYGCEPLCEAPRYCPIRARSCTLGCHCKLGLFRDGVTGLCVPKEQCLNTSLIVIPIIENPVITLFNLTKP